MSSLAREHGQMTRWGVGAVVAGLLFAAGCGGHGATEYRGSTSSANAYGTCSFCHNGIAVNLAANAKDPNLKCESCHADLTPGRVGPGHRRIPGPDVVPSPFSDPTHQLGTEAPFGSCAYCHNEFAVSVSPVSADLKCQTCHVDNLTPGIYAPGHRSRPDSDLVPAFAGPSHALGPEAPFGYCAYCHNDKATNMTTSNVAVPCQFCHADALLENFGPGHRSLPGPDQAPSFVGVSHLLAADEMFAPCAFCHNNVTSQAGVSSGHGALSFACSQCHSTLTSVDYGPGHRRVPRCAECHTEQRAHHDPGLDTITECTVCHTPHGSPNLFLINEEILTPSGATRSVRFTNLSGLADGSFASVSQPGSGVCEICHTTTMFYRSDGSGAEHIPYTCFTCHPHARAFVPR
jgi:predicted CXXCH cytochrome family protein